MNTTGNQNKSSNISYQSYLANGGEMGKLIRSFDWSRTSLGTPDTWSVSLLTTLSLMLNARFPMFLFWGNEYIQFYNDAYCSGLGETSIHPSALGKQAHETWEERWPLIQTQINHVVTTGLSTWSENEVLELNRNNRRETSYWTYSYSAIKDETGSITGVLAICYETTGETENRKQTEQLNEKLNYANKGLETANKELNIINEDFFVTQKDLQKMISNLAANESKFRSLVEQMPAAINVFRSRDLIIELVNNKMLEIWGRTADEVMNKPLLVAMPELTGQPFLKRLDEVLTTGVAYYSNDEKAYILRNGELSECYFNIVYQPIINPDGTITSIFQIASEVTEQIVASRQVQNLNEELAATNEELAVSNEELRSLNEEMQAIQDNLLTANAQLVESEERFRTMAEATDILIAVGDESSNAIYFNSTWMRVTGRSLPDLLNFGWVDLVHPEDRERYVNTYLSAFKKQVAVTSDFRLLDHTGNYLWLLAKLTPRFHASGSFAGYISSCVEITEQKKDEQRKNDFIAMVSHELKTPLTSLSGYLEILQYEMDGKKEKMGSALLEKAGRQINKMTTMINGFLNVSRLESGKLQMDKTRFDLAELMKENEDEIRSTLKSHEIIFYPVEITYVHADRDKIGHVINNLISNAVKYSSPGSKIQVACITTINNKAQVSVKDEGMGIAAEDIDKLFDRYYRVKNMNTQPVSGFGIGLYLCAEIIRQHNGEIWVESEAGKGSTFSFTLPL